MNTENKQSKALNKTDVNHSVLIVDNLLPYLDHELHTSYGKLIGIRYFVGWCGVFKDDFGEKNIPIPVIKPILRPITDVFKKIYMNGETFRPSVKLNFHLAFSSDEEFYNDIKNEIISVKLQRQLIKYHFDVFGLIEKGLAISIHDVK